MRFFVLSDNTDTLIGMRLAGMEGKLIESKAQFQQALQEAMSDPEVGVLLLTQKLEAFCPEEIAGYKLSCSQPLIVTIPDRHGGAAIGEHISQYVQEAVGVKI